MWIKAQAYLRVLKYWVARVFNLPIDLYRVRIHDPYVMATHDPEEAARKIIGDFTEDEMIDLDRTLMMIRPIDAIANVKRVENHEIPIFQSLADAIAGRVGEDPETTNRLNDLLCLRDKYPIDRIPTEVVLLAVEKKLLNPSELLTVQDALKQKNIDIDLGKSMTLKVSD